MEQLVFDDPNSPAILLNKPHSGHDDRDGHHPGKGRGKASCGANFPEFVFEGFDKKDDEPGIFGSKKHRLGEDHEEVTFKPHGQIEWHIEID